MTVSYKRSLITCILFGFLFIFLSVYFYIVGPQAYLDTKIHFVINSIVFVLTFGAFITMLIFTNNKDYVIDERDAYVQRKSYGIGLLVSLIYVFLISIILFMDNRYTGTVNAAWLWFLAYSTFAFSYFITSLVILFYYNRV
ncbi:hypothetical protein ACAG96_08450 [Candidatus Izemoplasma sp. B36]|uniref:hypothetical protein n=1 Tax=Candidatus Izemoplasma sp. B36 TaxID=3242468 RepID=UPI0035565355